ncbi:peptide/nickel transport system permease protein [Pseudomonas citronellolis]|uniref:Peptide/nickel transport system permease protein n=1 Tax=Pseudomonas citronellolis TaxID=53408 RepID=A0AAQ1KF09_9PSED|nr:MULTISPECIES: ABC transporter permease [Pseudomonas]MCP1604035.1 peptide/nickel transport system permease protein [Pseudomonas citronellolis]MCP1645377.1 peptide/nickel transport system permease protein [Pseudomonas citronellolis]MCP1657293.1 peptide/nickel transport system permease protein [Pseudomonas citronellolis]MCP1668766.1 peptide/nickel transport system permease protein [Pseudomonas citronellolis]MCP1699755.1 peptide/nickel transport system permease protein [Pseudomonas citronelloli
MAGPSTALPRLLPAPSRRRQLPAFLGAALARPGLTLAGVFLALLVLASLAPTWLVATDPLLASARHAFQAPSAAHWLGTDENGRDVLARLVHGARPSLLMGLAATAIGLLGGIAVGLAAGLGPRWLDAAAMRGIDVLLAFPELLLALVIITFWGQGLVNAMLAVGIAGIPRYARLVRAQAKVVRGAAYVEAAVTLGLSRPAVIWRHLLPNAIRPVLILATLGIGANIAAGASLSFLGFGAPPPAPEWGSMLSVGRNFLSNAWWLVAAPGTAVTLTVVAVTVLGRALLRYSEGKRP